MILQAPYTANDTITIKTTAGEEIVGRFVEETADTITLKKPMTLMATPQGVGLGPFTFTINPETNVKLFKSGILLVAKTDSEMAKQYISSTTGIKI